MQDSLLKQQTSSYIAPSSLATFILAVTILELTAFQISPGSLQAIVFGGLILSRHLSLQYYASSVLLLGC